MSSLPDYPDGLYRKIAGKRVTLFCGHYGSGKSTVAMSFAAMLRASLPAGTPVAVADLEGPLRSKVAHAMEMSMRRQEFEEGEAPEK